MEFFIPGLFLFLFAIAVSFLIAPKTTPLIASILSIVFLVYGVYDHYMMFASEYRLSTWQDGVKIYAPAIMIIAIILFIIYGILSFFTSGEVPVPSVPAITLPTTNTVTETIVNSISNVANDISNTTNNILSLNETTGNQNGNKNKNNTMKGPNNNKNKNALSRSFLETL